MAAQWAAFHASPDSRWLTAHYGQGELAAAKVKYLYRAVESRTNSRLTEHISDTSIDTKDRALLDKLCEYSRLRLLYPAATSFQYA
nr:hypothetical protein CFP56_34684 [Quercus suber]